MAGNKKAFQTSGFSGYNFDPADIVIVGIDIPNDEDPTGGDLVDDRINLPLDEAMIKNIAHFGVVEPVVVAKYGDKPYVIDGIQRVRHAREANIMLEERGDIPLRVPAITRKELKSDKSRFLGLKISMNEIRRENSPAQKAELIERWIERGYDEGEIATVFGITKQNVGQLRKIPQLSKKIRKSIEDGVVAATAATELADLTPEEQDQKFEEILESGQKPTADAIKKSVGKKPVAPPKRVVNRILDESDVLPQAREDTFWAGVLWMMGRMSDEDAGMADAVAEASKPRPRKKAEPKAKAEPVEPPPPLTEEQAEEEALAEAHRKSQRIAKKKGKTKAA